MKRRMRQAYRELKHRIETGNDLVISATAIMDYWKINQRLEGLLAKAGLLKG